jgi:hypothetical protein
VLPLARCRRECSDRLSQPPVPVSYPLPAKDSLRLPSGSSNAVVVRRNKKPDLTLMTVGLLPALGGAGLAPAKGRQLTPSIQPAIVSGVPGVGFRNRPSTIIGIEQGNTYFKGSRSPGLVHLLLAEKEKP